MEEKSSIIKVLIILFGHLWEVELTYIYIFAFKFTVRSQQPNIVSIICHRCLWHRWQICRRCRWYRWQIATDVVDIGGKFDAGITDTCGKFAPVSTTLEKLVANFAAGVIDTGGAPWLANISANFRKKFETVLMGYSGAGGKLIHEKNQKQKVSWHCPFNTKQDRATLCRIHC